MALRPALALIVVIAMGCSPAASSPTPTVTASPSATPVPATVSPSPTAGTPARVQVSDTPLPATAGAFVLFQAAGETRLRAISFGAEVNGILGGQVAADAVWSQSPFGIPYAVGSTAYDRDGKALGTIPWSDKTAPTWSSEGRFLCAIVPESATAGARMRLETASPGQPAKLITSGFATYSDNSVYRVLACDEGRDRVVMAQFGQGVVAARLWVYRLSNGNIVRMIDYAGANAWVASSADGSMIAESLNTGGTAGRWIATIRSADDGAQVATVDDFVGRGFSGDNAFVVGSTPSTAAVVDWKTGRKVWSATGPYGGFLPEPAGRRLAVGIGFVGGSDQREVYLVQADGSAPLLPARVRIALLY
jgi:hypothetical protein